MLDDSLLDDPAALLRADRQHALLALAGAGARIRIARRLADAAGLAALNPEGRPRTTVVAGSGSALTAAAALAALAVPNCQVLPLPPAEARAAGPVFTAGLGWQLPGWIGPLDLVVLASVQGIEGGLVSLAEQAYVRGCAIAVIAPESSPLAEAALQVRGLPLPYPPSTVDDGDQPQTDEPDLPAEDPGALWAFLAPLLALAEKTGVTQLPAGSLAAAADRLDEVAVRCRPDAQAYTNPAKTLAAQLSDTVPLLWADGPVTGAAADRFAAMLADRAGLPALTGLLPRALTAHRGMFVGRLGAGADPDDFFRDRVEEPEALQLQLVLLRRTPGVEELAEAGHSVSRARRLADAHEVRLTEYSSSLEDPLQALAELVGLTDFAAVYLGLAGQGRPDGGR
ncbi:SIS domain-containing protein [Kitasatospora sp. NPDC048540]|uniref:SIS domain-containing protein n=1 Tax=unclassified Kitasatospora TaxID=2633591 RepID=UPI00053AAE52|nr:SIS domain-containing protein [Kitasatospora sp. MBT63]